LGLYQAFVSRLQQAIVRQGEMVKQRELSVQAQAKKWVQASHNVKVMEQLIEKAQAEETLIESKQEQKIQDDRPFRKGSGF
jgi:flagellar export protein FliJ